MDEARRHSRMGPRRGRKTVGARIFNRPGDLYINEPKKVIKKLPGFGSYSMEHIYRTACLMVGMTHPSRAFIRMGSGADYNELKRLGIRNMADFEQYCPPRHRCGRARVLSLHEREKRTMEGPVVSLFFCMVFFCMVFFCLFEKEGFCCCCRSRRRVRKSPLLISLCGESRSTKVFERLTRKRG